jgi:hypothetical protein
MKSSILAAAAFAGEAIARSHIHAHSHGHLHHKRDVIEEKITITEFECWLEGHTIPKAECDQGIANGSLKWADDGKLVAAPTTLVSVIISISNFLSPPTHLLRRSSPPHQHLHRRLLPHHHLRRNLRSRQKPLLLHQSQRSRL